MIEAIRDKRIYTIPENTDPELMINRARGKPTEQSSTATPTCAASKAVDGNSDPVFAHHSCSQTLPRKGSWWQVDLQVVYDIRAVVLSSTTDNSYLNWEQDNLALRKRASQSSSHTPANGAGNAVDNFIVKNSASVTAVEMHAWWQAMYWKTSSLKELVRLMLGLMYVKMANCPWSLGRLDASLAVRIQKESSSR
ncbi:hypothetical protein NP493_770g01006 [Ridgeia piscesae]|uniref:Fucolectin tachylectin-4 pentraxin-1 domain-containing protein n=1 Tax=Ridgeia piscesae TaxID=27915 RepID=A0AAD9NNH9_RIDPI|nr:hypothetical protein NP493_770g01006 [Ridgeia piscesae]